MGDEKQTWGVEIVGFGPSSRGPDDAVCELTELRGSGAVRFYRPGEPDGPPRETLGMVHVQPNAGEAPASAIDRALVDAGRSALQREYYADIKAAAEEIREEIRSGECTEPSDRIHEYADGCEWTIYTHRHPHVLMASVNEDEGFDRLEGMDMSLDGPMGLAPLIYCIVEADLWDELGDTDPLFEAAELSSC